MLTAKSKLVGLLIHTHLLCLALPRPFLDHFLEQNAGDAPRDAAEEGSTPAARRATTLVAQTPSEAAVGEAVTSPSEEAVVASGPLRRALRFVRRLVRPHFERLCERRDDPPRRAKESVADLVPVLKAGSPIALECCAAFGIDAAGWMQTAKYASQSYRVVEEHARKRLARRRGRP